MSDATTAIQEAVDAARYRWLKEHGFSQSFSTGKWYLYHDLGAGDIDEAIDVAMKECTK